MVANGLAIPLAGAPPPAGALPPVTYLLSQLALAQAADLVPDAYGARHMHNRTAIILHRTCTPTPLNSDIPSFDELPLIRCVSFSTPTDMTLYVLDV